jgi:hypothetical protein
MPGRLTRLSAIGVEWKPNLCRPVAGGLGRNSGGRSSTPYGCIHQLSAMFCTATAVVVVHLKTLPEIAGETVETKSALWPRA